MVFRDDDRHYRWPLPNRSASGGETAREDAATSLSLKDTLTELALTVIGFAAVILLITAAVGALYG
ncbi:MAG TPA: hypothetical protein VKV32_00175 [Stellaceae bacterium]|nr:hypothetical protein [Stellaceae bacterium]